MVSDLRLGVPSGLLHYRDETVQLVGSVLHDAGRAVGLLEAVGPLHRVSIPGLPLGLLITAVGVVYSVLELVLGIGLQETRAKAVLIAVQLTAISMMLTAGIEA